MSFFDGKTVLITGGANGIGRLLALRTADLGANIVLLDLDESALAKIDKEITAKGVKCFSAICDVSNVVEVKQVASSLKDASVSVDVLINNAGVVSGKPLLDISDESIRRTFDVNTLALFWTTRAFLPDMIDRDDGVIVTIASAGGLIGAANLTDYNASKFAAVGFDESLRYELRRSKSRVRTLVVCPFFIDSKMFAGAKTRFSLLLPLLEESYVVDKILRGIERRKQRLVMPRFVGLNYALRILPVRLFDWTADFFGVNRTMDDFVGRGGVDPD